MPRPKPLVRRFGQVDFDSMIPLLGAAADDADIFVTRRGAFGANRILTRAQIIAGAGVVPDPLLLGDGAVGAPTYSFTSNPTTGAFLSAAGIFGITADGVLGLQVAEAGGLITIPTFGPILAPDGTAAAPSFAFASEPTTGIFKGFINVFDVTLGGVRSWTFQQGQFSSQQGSGPALLAEVSTNTNPTVIPHLSSLTSGLGGNAGQPSLIAGGLSCMSVSATGAVRRVGFYDGSPIALQTGVAVTTAAIHAALVALRLFTA